MGNRTKRGRFEVVPAVTGNARKRGVDLQPSSPEIKKPHANGGVAEGALEALMPLLQRALGLSLLDQVGELEFQQIDPVFQSRNFRRRIH
jgi:hypothetical protein